MTNGVQPENANTLDPTEIGALRNDYYENRIGVESRLTRLEAKAEHYDRQYMAQSTFWEIIARASMGMILPVISILIAIFALSVTVLDKLGVLGRLVCSLHSRILARIRSTKSCAAAATTSICHLSAGDRNWR